MAQLEPLQTSSQANYWRQYRIPIQRSLDSSQPEPDDHVVTRQAKVSVAGWPRLPLHLPGSQRDEKLAVRPATFAKLLVTSSPRVERVAVYVRHSVASDSSSGLQHTFHSMHLNSISPFLIRNRVVWLGVGMGWKPMPWKHAARSDVASGAQESLGKAWDRVSY